jgi:ubiquinone/menaquinone biosynthesis C-methylase UbiE
MPERERKVTQSRFQEGDAEVLPSEDASVDVLTSLIGTMFALRPEAVARELLRVCCPGKKIRYADAGAHILQLFWSCLTYASAPLDLRLDNKLSR